MHKAGRRIEGLTIAIDDWLMVSGICPFYYEAPPELSTKAQRVGIQVILIDESYTSKCSFLDNEPVGKHKAYAGKRVHRGLFRASDGRHINADVNGSYNILRKVIPDAISNGIRGAVVHPVQLTLYKTVPPVS